MSVVVMNVGCSLLASIIYDISKVCLGKFNYKTDEYSKIKIEEFIREKSDDKYEILYASGQFNNFLNTPLFKDTIENYIIYKITGNCEGNIRKMLMATLDGNTKALLPVSELPCILSLIQ